MGGFLSFGGHLLGVGGYLYIKEMRENGKNNRKKKKKISGELAKWGAKIWIRLTAGCYCTKSNILCSITII